MTRNPDILFMAEYIKNVLYFATVRQGKVLKSTADTHYFCIDNDLVYENYYSDFGPLNLGCVYKYCRLLNDKLKQFFNNQIIVHYTSVDSKKKANAAFVLGCYGVLYLSLTPRDALKPLVTNGQSYRPFQDATMGDSPYTISLLDCFIAIKKAKDLGFFDFQDFNYEEYNRLDKIQGGDLNWIVPGKFLAFIGPVDYSVSLYHPPDMYIGYFLENNVKIVIRLNKSFYDGKVFTDVGIDHYDLFFPDGSCPPRNILSKFMKISEESHCAIGVHCKAGLGRTGSLIGCYLIKHYRMTAHEAIGWMRICRPGSVIGHQQGWLEQLEPWLIKQGNLYRKRMYQDTEMIPTHEFGVYSIAEKALRQRPVIFNNPPSPPSQKRQIYSPQFSPAETKQDENDADEEIFITSCDLTIPTDTQPTQLKGCVIRNNVLEEDRDDTRNNAQNGAHTEMSFWKKYFDCRKLIKCFNDSIWHLAVRCVKITPKSCSTNKCCLCIDKVAPSKIAGTQACEWRCRTPKVNSNSPRPILKRDESISISRRGNGGGEPRVSSPSRVSTSRTQRNSARSDDSNPRSIAGYTTPLTSFRTSQGPVLKTINDARNFLMRSTNRDNRESSINTTLTVTPHYSRVPQYLNRNPPTINNIGRSTPSTFSAASSQSNQPQQRRRLGRSPSPPQSRISNEQTRATNTPSSSRNFLAREASKTNLKEVLSRLKLVSTRNGSVGAASLGARREAPAPRRAPSVRSDERSLATQGDKLNSIKFQRRFKDSLHSEKVTTLMQDKISLKEKLVEKVNSKSSAGTRSSRQQEKSVLQEPPAAASRNFFGPPRPSSPKGRRSPHTSFY